MSYPACGLAGLGSCATVLWSFDLGHEAQAVLGGLGSSFAGWVIFLWVWIFQRIPSIEKKKARQFWLGIFLAKIKKKKKVAQIFYLKKWHM